MHPSPSQKLAIESEPRSLLVLAGPGAGKTFCLTERIRFLIEQRGFDPARICAFTFTNKAAGEIAERLERRLGESAEEITRGTIHAFCADLLREFPVPAGLESGFGIADEEYQLNALRRLEGFRKWHRSTLTRFSAHRFRGDELMRNDAELFKRYEEFLAARNVVDFDTLVIKAADLVEGPAGDDIRARWDVVLVDEFQDLNPVQYRVVRALAKAHRHVFAVGDDDQSIYSWAGADPAVFKHFVNDFGITARIHLAENHRCPADIFALARKLVDVNLPIFGDRDAPHANRPAAFPVNVAWFETDEAEADWLVSDIRRDRETFGHHWGDVALLFRTHAVGDLLETACIDAGIPCRRAQGRSLADDPVIGYVVAAARAIHTPGDDLYRDAFFKVVLSHALFDEARAKADEENIPLWTQLNRMAVRLPKADENGRQIRRALADCRNLEAVGMQQSNLMALVQELLSRRVGRLRSILDEHHDDLTDPAGNPEVVMLANRLRAARTKRQEVFVPELSGAGIPIKAMLDAIGVRAVCGTDANSPDAPAEQLSPGDVLSIGLALGVFKAAQLLEMESSAVAFTSFTAIDLETTARDTGKSEIIEIAATRVRGGEIAEKFTSLVKPNVAIDAGASAVTGITEKDLVDAQTFAEIWPRFKEFVGTDVLVAHNGYQFDFPILSRMVEETGDTFDAITFDSLPLARDLVPTSRKLGDLARHFGIDPGNSHRALDDTQALALVMLKLGSMKLARSRKTALVDLLGHLGVALALTDRASLSDEARLFVERLTPVFVLGRYGNALDNYEESRATHPSIPTRDDVIALFGGANRMDSIRRDRTADERYPAAMRRLRRLIAGIDEKPFAEQLGEFLQRVTLSTQDGVEPAHERVNLLTLHATKGLEFSRVYVIGCEDSQLPGGSPTQGPKAHEVEEGRRLLYVGMTRTIDRLVLTYCANRAGKPAGGHRFLDEMGLAPVPPEDDDE
ncbi:MAG TPA: UvrD-helicase domain-containing protein [Gemmatimonadaceae bacterium]|nr:UvrD-helicase domain-containing protein [Gemmatimonadaceae bacterium]